MQTLSIIIPVLNEDKILDRTLASLMPMRARGVEVIVVDGGSTDGTPAIAEKFADRVIRSDKGRALQMNAGARSAKGDVLLFLHADARLPLAADQLILSKLAEDGQFWGRFDVRLSGQHFLLRVISRCMNWRSRWTGIATGDQGIFVRRAIFEAAGGFAPIPLMEDIEFTRRLRHYGRPIRVRPPLISSSRRWEKYGIVRTILLMWGLRLAYSLGVPPERLATHYEHGKS